MAKPGYAIECDCFPPSQLRSTFELKRWQGMYLAGQINGTTGHGGPASARRLTTPERFT